MPHVTIRARRCWMDFAAFDFESKSMTHGTKLGGNFKLAKYKPVHELNKSSALSAQIAVRREAPYQIGRPCRLQFLQLVRRRRTF